MKALVDGLVRLFPQRGTLTGVVFEGKVYDLQRAKYGPGYVIHPEKGLRLPIQAGGDFVVLPAEEKPEAIPNPEPFKVSGVELVAFEAEQMQYAVFAAVLSHRPDPESGKNYAIVDVGDLLFLFVARWVVGRAQEYRYPSTPTWMFARIRIVRASHPDLYVWVKELRKGRCIAVKKIVSVTLQAQEPGATAEARQEFPDRVKSFLEREKVDVA
jgi:hypothetical protein